MSNSRGLRRSYRIRRETGAKARFGQHFSEGLGFRAAGPIRPFVVGEGTAKMVSISNTSALPDDAGKRARPEVADLNRKSTLVYGIGAGIVREGGKAFSDRIALCNLSDSVWVRRVRLETPPILLDSVFRAPRGHTDYLYLTETHVLIASCSLPRASDEREKRSSRASQDGS